MNPSESGWLWSYFELRKWQTSSYSAENLKNLRHRMEESFYQYIQPTGLMYGQALQLPKPSEGETQLDTSGWSEEDKLKVTLVESFLQAALVFQQSHQADDFDALSEKLAKHILDFYSTCYPDLSRSGVFGKRPKDVFKQAEQLIEKRLQIRGRSRRNLLGTFFHHSLLFLDVFFFKLWVNPSEDNNLERISKKNVELRFTLIKIVIASAHADRILQKEEKELFETFLDSCLLPKEERRIARIFFEDGLHLDELYMPSFQWVLKKFVLEVGLLTSWADRKVVDEEMDFLRELRKRLKLDEKDFKSSLLSIETFVVNNWDQLHFLQDTYDLEEVGEHLVEHLSDVVESNKAQIINRLEKKTELNALIRKHYQEGLSQEEKDETFRGLMEVLGDIPAFLLIAMPGTFLNLPILLRVLPQEVLQSDKFLDR